MVKNLVYDETRRGEKTGKTGILGQEKKRILWNKNMGYLRMRVCVRAKNEGWYGDCGWVRREDLSSRGLICGGKRSDKVRKLVADAADAS